MPIDLQTVLDNGDLLRRDGDQLVPVSPAELAALPALADAFHAKASTALPVHIFYNEDTSSWPSASTVPAGVRVVWVQPVTDGPAPPSGGRPGREPGDLVYLRQSGA